MQVLLNKQYLNISFKGEKQRKYYRVEEREPFKYRTNDGATDEFTTVATGQNSGDVVIENLKPKKLELYFIIPGIKDGLDYYFRLPSGKDSWGVQELKDSGFLTNIDSPYFAPNPNWGFYIGNEYRFTVKAVNDIGKTVTPIVYFSGMKYFLEEVTDPDTIDKLDNKSIPSAWLEHGGWKQ